MRINRSIHVGMLLVQALMPGALFLFGGLVRRFGSEVTWHVETRHRN